MKHPELQLKRLVYREFGEPLSVLSLQDYSDEQPVASQVRVNWLSSPIAAADRTSIRGLYGSRQKLPAVPGFDGCGEIVALGEKVKNVKLGQKVIHVPQKVNPPPNGTWQDSSIYEVSELTIVPEVYAIDNDSLGQFHLTALSAWVMLIEEGKACPGDWVIVTAAASSIGMMMIQVSKMFGFNVIAVVRRKEQKQMLLEAGAAEVICTPDEEILQRVKIITKLKGAQLAIDAIGGEATGQCIRALADGGRMILYGLLAQERYAAIDSKVALFNSLRIQGFWIANWLRNTEPALRLRIQNQVFHFMAAGKLKSVVQEKFALKDYAKALKLSETPGLSGKIVFGV